MNIFLGVAVILCIVLFKFLFLPVISIMTLILGLLVLAGIVVFTLVVWDFLG